MHLPGAPGSKKFRTCSGIRGFLVSGFRFLGLGILPIGITVRIFGVVSVLNEPNKAQLTSYEHVTGGKGFCMKHSCKCWKYRCSSGDFVDFALFVVLQVASGRFSVVG